MRGASMRLGLVCLAVVAAAIAVAGGNAGNRDGDPKFDAVPGPGRVTHGENIAYRAAFTNTGSSMFTKVTFRMRYPYIESGAEPYKEAADPVDHTCPTTPAKVTLSNGYLEWVCTFGQLGPGTPGEEQLVVSVVWQVPTPDTATVNCPAAANLPGCLVSNGRWTVKEGLNDQSDPNDAFPPGGLEVRAVMLAAGGESQELLEAGGYELPTACTNPLGTGSLRTKQAVSLANKVSTTICIPSFLANATDLGLATTILERNARAGDWAAHPNLGTATVCIADLGANCAEEGDYTPFEFSFDKPVKYVFRIAGSALDKGDRITQVFHAELGAEPQPLAKCPALPALSTDPNGCYTSIAQNKKTKDWIIQAQAPGNGLWGW